MGSGIASRMGVPGSGSMACEWMRDAIPELIEDEVATRLAHLEARGAAWGAWRRQVIAGEQLVRRRRLGSGAR